MADFLPAHKGTRFPSAEIYENKGDTWPPEDYEAGLRFLDPCQQEDDHDLHWNVLPDGTMEPLTLTGEYTIGNLKLWRSFLQHHRARRIRFQEQAQTLERLLATKALSESRRLDLESRLNDLREWLEPPIFDRPRHAEHPE